MKSVLAESWMLALLAMSFGGFAMAMGGLTLIPQRLVDIMT